MLYTNVLKKIEMFLWRHRFAIFIVISVFLYAADANAAFSSLTNAGKSIFSGLNQLIKPAAVIGVACVCIGGVFGNFNWKWLFAILIGVLVMTVAASGGGTQGPDMFAGS